jgi:hypothetical protein
LILWWQARARTFGAAPCGVSDDPAADRRNPLPPLIIRPSPRNHPSHGQRAGRHCPVLAIDPKPGVATDLFDHADIPVQPNPDPQLLTGPQDPGRRRSPHPPGRPPANKSLSPPPSSARTRSRHTHARGRGPVNDPRHIEAPRAQSISTRRSRTARSSARSFWEARPGLKCRTQRSPEPRAFVESSPGDCLADGVDVAPQSFVLAHHGS